MKKKYYYIIISPACQLYDDAVVQGRTDHLETRALPEGPGCPWYLFHRLF
ncbi:unnamed protein product [Staurois parvus]|uniref:Uncharacterized protein n=1 Tax=Staurois parvus TaxID=386267 RepID=A0ABN9GQD9_9NEOB|nr:unnamed protein product [Staurois parvus]